MVSKEAAAIYIRLQADSAGLHKAMGEATSAMRKFSSEARANVTEARGSVALLGEEIGVHLPRHLQTFIAKLPGVSAAMSAAFNTVAVLALAKIAFEAGEKIVEFFKKSGEQARAAQEQWKSTQSSLVSVNRELGLTNDRLDNEIAKLEKKPQNLLKQALDEDAIAGAKLAEQLEKDSKALDDLVSKEHVGFWGRFLGDEGSTDTIEKQIKGFRERVTGVQSDYAGPIQRATDKGDKAQVELLEQMQLAELQKIYGAFDKFANPMLQQLRVAQQNHQGFSGYKFGPDESKAIQMLSDALEMSGGEQEMLGRGYLESHQKDAIAALQSAGPGPAQLNLGPGKIAAEIAKQQRDAYPVEDTRMLDELGKTSGKMGQDFAEDVTRTGDRWKTYNEATTRAAEISAANTAAMEKARVELALQTGQLSKHDGAVQLATLHQREYLAIQKALQDQRDRILADSNLTEAERQGQAAQVTNQLSELGGRNDLARMQDQAVENSTSALGELDRAANELTQDFLESGSKIREILDKAFSDFNKQVVDFLTMRHPKEDFGSVGANLARGVTQMGVQHLEGSVMKALGFGGGKKPTGTATDPLHVVMGSGAAGSTSDLFTPGSPMAKLAGWLGFGSAGAGGAQSALAAAAAPTGLSTTASDITALIPMMAAGGPISSNMPAIVGERGPELFLPSSSGRIVPNDALGGGGMTLHANIDARGSSDPAAVEAACHRAIAAATPSIIAMGMKAQTDRNKRMPGTRRS